MTDDKIAPMPEPSLHPTHIYDFAGWLTTRPGTLTVGATHDASYMAEAVGEYLKTFPERFSSQSDQSARIAELESMLKRDDPVMFKAAQEDDEERAMLRQRIAELERELLIEKGIANGAKELHKKAEAELAEALKDAGRYRWLRDADRSDSVISYDELLRYSNETLDAAIDAALAKERDV